MHRVLFMCALAGLACATQPPEHGSTPAPGTAAPVREPPAGAVRGAWLRARRGRRVEAYRGLRYAHPPVGPLRFQPPQPITQYSGEEDATAEGPACPQPTYGDYYVDEDCLRLNVYTPAVKSKPMPVVVYFHAGGFYSVSGRSDVAGPEYLLERDLVLVAVNYRLASLGFLSTGDEQSPGNNGFKDQVAALRWVRRNIAAFGGDPNSVTVSGYSAGSFSVMLHLVSPMSKGLFHRAISMSGSPVSQIVLPHHQKELAIKQAELVGCPSHSSKAILDCLRTKSSKELGDSLSGFFQFAWDPVLIWVPIIEPDFGQERFLIEHPLTSLREGRFQHVPYIISQTQDEFFWKAYTVLDNTTLTNQMDTNWTDIAPISFYLSPPSGPPATALRTYYLGGENKLVNNTETRKALGWLYNDAIIGFGVHTLVNAMAVYSREPIYYYEFTYIGNSSHYVDPETNKPTGAAHHDDLIYLFSLNASFPLIALSDSRDSRLVDRMTDMWYNFATSGDPNPTPTTPGLGCSWARFTRDSRRYTRVDSECSARDKLYEERFNEWEKLYSPKDCEYCTYNMK